ncbi:MAG: OsmC family protein [Candidatus Thorarchaeota archaeon]|jgi:uncharacterized OsmC-like protein
MEEHAYKLSVRVTRPMFVGVKIPDMEEFEVTTTADWWPDAPGGFHTPHVMLLSAAASCLLVMMFRTSSALHTQFKAAKVDAIGTMGEHDGIWSYDDIHLKVRVEIEDESFRDKVMKAVDMAGKTCPVANSLRTPIIIDTEIVVS